MPTAVLRGRLVLPDRVVDEGQVVVENGLIQSVRPGTPNIATDDYGDAYILPGLIDLHVHGIAGADVMDGKKESIEIMARRFVAHGVTSFLPTTVTQSLDQTYQAIDAVVDAMRHPLPDSAQILGIHLEGPFINPEFKGMQNERFIIPPDESIARELLDRGQGKVRIVTLAPEMPRAIELIKLFGASGVVVSIGHSGATYGQTLEAATYGASQVTHCFNAMSPLHHRQPGVVGAVLLSDSLRAELIPDGIHVSSAAMELLIRCKSREMVMAVTDAMSATEMPDGTYEFGGQEVTVSEGIARLANGQLASSTITMERAVAKLVRLCRVPLQDAVYMAATTPANSVGLGSRKGQLVAGYDADITVLDNDFRTLATWVRGERVFASSPRVPPQ